MKANVKTRQLSSSNASNSAADMRLSKRKSIDLVEDALSDIPAQLATCVT